MGASTKAQSLFLRRLARWSLRACVFRRKGLERYPRRIVPYSLRVGCRRLQENGYWQVASYSYTFGTRG